MREHEPAEQLHLGDYLVEPRLNRLSRQHMSVILEPKVMHLLLCLAERPGQVMRQAEIRRELWGSVHVVDGVLARAAYQLRRALARLGGGLTLETVRRVGYRLRAEPERAPAGRPPLLAALSGPRPAWTAAALAAGLSLYLAVSRDVASPLPAQAPPGAREAHRPTPAQAQAAAPGPRPRSAVRRAAPRPVREREILVFAEGRFQHVPSGTAFPSAKAPPAPPAPAAPPAPRAPAPDLPDSGPA
ncbi:MAG TPA: winged helix-turn-helix domain-containing protein [Allosphingosinicella sp.]|nr:winged helix-turn-helix domain-containing protein [Allosphingosinicella sp.]